MLVSNSSNACWFFVITLAPSDWSVPMDASTSQDKKEAEMRLDLILQGCKTKRRNNSNSSSEAVLYFLPDVAKVVRNTKDSYIVNATVEDFRAFSKDLFSSSQVENELGKGFYGTRNVVQQFLEFMEERVPKAARDVLPPPTQLVRALLVNKCNYMEPTPQDPNEYYRVKSQSSVFVFR